MSEQRQGAEKVRPKSIIAGALRLFRLPRGRTHLSEKARDEWTTAYRSLSNRTKQWFTNHFRVFIFFNIALASIFILTALAFTGHVEFFIDSKVGSFTFLIFWVLTMLVVDTMMTNHRDYIIERQLHINRELHDEKLD